MNGGSSNDLNKIEIFRGITDLESQIDIILMSLSSNFQNSHINYDMINHDHTLAELLTLLQLTELS